MATVIIPILGALQRLHQHQLGHHHISPLHAFLLDKRANKLALSAPCPLAAPQDINEILVDDFPDEFFPPDMWVRSTFHSTASVDIQWFAFVLGAPVWL